MIPAPHDEHSQIRLFGKSKAREAHILLISQREENLRRERTWTIRLERFFLIAGLTGFLLCLGCAVWMLLARRSAAHIALAVRSQSRSDPSTVPDPSATAAAFTPQERGVVALPVVVGRVEIPAIHLITPLLSGDDSMSLTEGAGHIPGTAYPGGLGTVGIAGHRDTHFRLLRKVAPGMDIRLVDRTGTYHYRVTSTEIVTPEQVSVLDIISEPGLVLITCYPFNYLGNAPKRFVVHAALLSVAPD